MSGNGGTSGFRDNFRLWVVSAIVALFVLASTVVPGIASMATNASAEPTPLTVVFPDVSRTGYSDAATLIESVAAGLGIGGVTPFPDNSHALSTPADELNRSRAFGGALIYYDCIHYWGTASDGTKIGALYNIDDRLVQIKAYQESRGTANGTPAIGGWKASSFAPESYLEIARSVALWLGIPLELLTDSDLAQDIVTDESGSVYEVVTWVKLAGRTGGQAVLGANLVELRFANLNLSTIDVFPFYESKPLTSIVDISEAASKSLEYLNSNLSGQGSLAILGGPWYGGIGLDQDTMSLGLIISWTFLPASPSAQIPTNEKTGVVLVGAETGTVLRLFVINGLHEIGEMVSMHHFPYAIVVVASMLIVFASLVIVFTWPPEVIIFLFWGLFLPLYTRLKGSVVLDQYKRGLIHGFIVAHPGVHFSEIRRSLRLPNGLLVYHLDIMLKNGDVFCKRNGFLMRYFDSKVSFDKADTLVWTDAQVEIIRLLQDRGETSKSDIMKELKASRQTTHYHLGKLIKSGVVSTSIIRGRRYYSIAPGTDVDLSPFEP